ncbi:MAG: hypothetical protein H6766_00185 [Candidatus Peribacteria bacterium]|nr:MAG: hypothetical protein H6766_00185 [Candidatus Peribacteria bacterium]
MSSLLVGSVPSGYCVVKSMVRQMMKARYAQTTSRPCRVDGVRPRPHILRRNRGLVSMIIYYDKSMMSINEVM